MGEQQSSSNNPQTRRNESPKEMSEAPRHSKPGREHLQEILDSYTMPNWAKETGLNWAKETDLDFTAIGAKFIKWLAMPERPHP